MVEHQIICKILAEKSTRILFDNGITVDLFPEDYREELQYILDHKNKYGNIPDLLSFLDKFNDFEVVEVTESDEYLIDRLMETILHQKQLVMANQYGEKLGESDSRKAFQYLKEQVRQLQEIERKSMKATDITKNTARGDEYTRKVAIEGIVGITTGNEGLDKVLHGWLEEDLVIILGRTNEGKSWVLKYFLVVAWQAGYKVLLYSGEMSETIVGYRFDTLNNHFSNNALMSGEENLGDNFNSADYVQYLGNLQQNEVPFLVITPKTLGKRLDIPTLRYLIEVYEPDIIGIDQISLMDDYRAKKGEQTRIQYTHIAEDLYLCSEDFRIPILAPSQANRGAESKNKKKDGSKGEELPDVHEISESDGIGQNATRVISMKVNGVQLKLGVKKNRYGPKGYETSFLWDIDRGIIKPFGQPGKPDTPPQTGEAQPPQEVTSGEDLF